MHFYWQLSGTLTAVTDRDAVMDALMLLLAEGLGVQKVGAWQHAATAWPQEMSLSCPPDAEYVSMHSSPPMSFAAGLASAVIGQVRSSRRSEV